MQKYPEILTNEIINLFSNTLFKQKIKELAITPFIHELFKYIIIICVLFTLIIILLIIVIYNQIIYKI